MNFLLTYIYVIIGAVLCTSLLFIVGMLLNKSKNTDVLLIAGSVACMTFGICMTTIKTKQYAQQIDLMVNAKDTTNIDMCLARLESIDKVAILINSIAEVESGDNPKCQGGGWLQIQPICLKEANLILGKNKFKAESVYNKKEATEIFNLIQNKYNKKGDIEVAIRLWNGGSNYTKAGTQGYYEKVIRVYNRKIDEHLDMICKQYKSIHF